MASPATSTFRPPISPPPPVYLRSSPPPVTESDIPSPPPFRKGLSDSPEAKPNPHRISRKPLKPTPLEIGHDAVIHNSPVSPVKIDYGSELPQASSALIEDSRDGYSEHPPPVEKFTRMSIDDWTPAQQHGPGSGNFIPPPRADSIPPIQLSQPQDRRHTPASSSSWSLVGPHGKEDAQNHEKTTVMPEEHSSNKSINDASDVSRGSVDSMPEAAEVYQPLQYHHQPFQDITNRQNRASPSGNMATRKSSAGLSIPRPSSAYSSVSDLANRGRNLSPRPSPNSHARGSSRHSTASPDNRPLSYIDLMNVPYPQPPPTATMMSKSYLRGFVGNNASLLGHRQTFEMYLANVKKANDPSTQYEFAVFMVNAVREMPPEELEDGGSSTQSGAESSEVTRARLLREARSILQLLASRGHPFSQYYLADGFASGLFSNGKEDWDRAFPLFVAASKHGHAEAGYRVGLCYEFGWGNKIDGAKAAQFYRQAASKNHPGAMLRLAKACIAGEMGLGKRYREGITWLKRAAESADELYNAGPYELGLLHVEGYGPDVFPDPAYAAQLFTRSAELGHAEANYRLGDAYEHGKLKCPKDATLSIHFYTGAAQAGHPQAMMALCAWYLVGAPPFMEKDENEAYEWAKKAAETGLAKAQYAVGYFTEMGIGCRRDPLEANVWYVRAADQGDERAKHRIAAIRAAAEGGSPNPTPPVATGARKLKHKSSTSPSITSPEGEKAKPKRFGIF
ncbi:chitin synthase activator [Paecilomyces variotii No. 5]|uniref:Chitin synthase activator n=1 Tax=Byssochlamys spectabilis (strain No. 5 / NBRC 109023) TaxID=1356009 RepID=V5G7Z8_BYSSN|nr:chitin synthase activator [Paecilomyces variotii No. 5]